MCVSSQKFLVVLQALLFGFIVRPRSHTKMATMLAQKQMAQAAGLQRASAPAVPKVVWGVVSSIVSCSLCRHITHLRAGACCRWAAPKCPLLLALEALPSRAQPSPPSSGRLLGVGRPPARPAGLRCRRRPRCGEWAIIWLLFICIFLVDGVRGVVNG